MSMHLFACGLTRSPAADNTNCWAGFPLQPTIWMTAPFAVEPQATSMHLPLAVCSVPLTKFHRCAPVPLQPYICSATPSEKFEFGTSMHLLFQLLSTAPA